MYVGHAALALVVKGRRPHLSLALLVPAAFGPDWVQWILDVFGQTSPQLSHSLVSVGICSVLAALMYRLVVRGSGADAVLLALLWASHWPADLLTGIKPTWPGGPDVGLNLYEYVAFEVIM